jgi:AsmA protein
MKGGVLFNDDFLFKAPLATASGKGEIGIGAQTLDYRVNPVAMADENGIGGISVPVIISGTWADPKFRPDLQALIDQNLAGEKAALQARLKEEEAALRARAKAKEAELRARVAAERAAARARAEAALGVEVQEGESLEDAAKRKAEEELKKGLLNLLGGN